MVYNQWIYIANQIRSKRKFNEKKIQFLILINEYQT